jgi:uncharacterized protein (DUF1499 family)
MARIARTLAAVALFAFAVGPAAAHFEVVAPMIGFVVFALGILLAAAATVLAVVALIAGGREGRSKALIGLLAGLAVVTVTIVVASPGASVPRINDITTDLADPPRFVHAGTLAENQGSDLSYPGEEFAAQQRQGYPDLAGLRLAMPPDQAFARVQLAARAVEGWHLTREDPAARALEGYDTSQLFRFKDDFVIEVREDDGAAVVHMRSKSRDGRGDVGANAKRIRGFFARLK